MLCIIKQYCFSWFFNIIFVLLLKCHRLLGAGERHSTRDKGHEEGGSAYAKAGSSLGSVPDYNDETLDAWITGYDSAPGQVKRPPYWSVKKARCVANLWERVCLYISTDADSPIWISEKFVVSPGSLCAHSLAPPPPASSRLCAASSAPHPPCCTPRPRAKKSVWRVRAREESAPAECCPDQRGPTGERGLPWAQAVAASLKPRTLPLRPP